MKINYILSETTSGATSSALKEVIKQAEADVFANVLVLVPEPKSIAVERELLDYSSNGAFSNIFVYSFVRLLSRIGEIEEKDLISRQTCVMMIRKIILDNINNLHCYQKTARAIGFAEKIYETIQQFKASSFTVQDVSLLAEKSSGALKSKMTDIAFLFDEYEKALGDGFFDDCDRLRKLGEFAKSSEFIKNADVYVVGFDNVTSDMVEVLKQFAIHAKSITFSCVYFNENRKDKYIQDNALFHKFLSISTALKYPYNPKFVKSSFLGDFWNIQNYLYSTENKVFESNGNVEIFELDNKTKEIDYLANKILSEVKSGRRFKDIAVIDGEFEKDIDLIAKVFEEYEIPYFITRSYDASGHFFVKFIKNSIEVFVSRFSSDKVLKWLSNPMLNIKNYAEFENFVKEFGINYSAFYSEVTKEQVEDDEKRNRINDVIKLIKLFKNQFSEIFSAENMVSVFVGGIKKLAEFVNSEERLEELAKVERENNLEIEAEISSAVYEKFNKLNDNIEKFLGEKIVSTTEFLQIYLSGFSEEEINLVPVSVDSVLIQKKSDGLYKIKDLFIVGAVEGSFPMRMQDTGILQDNELDKVFEITDKKVDPTIKDINKKEKFSIFELLLLPTEKLFISYSNRSYGATNKPARVIARLEKLFNIEPRKSYKNNGFITKKIAEKQFARHIGSYLVGGDNTLNELNKEYNQLKNIFSPHFSEYISNLSFGEKEFTIAEAKEIYFYNGKTSVSQLERYFACPYSFFARYGLKLKDNKDASLSSLDIGTIVHKFAELFTKEIRSFDKLDDKTFEKRTREVLSQALKELGIVEKRNVAVIGFIYDEVVRLGKYLYFEQNNSSFKNDSKLNEFEFSGKNAVKLKIDDDTVILIEGKIDRIDKFGDYIRIIDYKTGETSSDLSAVYFGKKVQLVSYLSACEKLGQNKVAGLFYFPIHSDFVKIQQKVKNNYKMQGFLLDNIDVVKYMDSTLSLEKTESDFVPLKIKNNDKVRQTGEFEISYGVSNAYLSEDEFNGLKNYTEDLCAGAVREILSGNIEPSPIAKLTEKESSECKFCKLNGFCGKEQARFGMARRCGGNVTAESFAKEEK